MNTTLPLWCRLGFHRWYLDSAWFSSALRCSRCPHWQDEQAGALVEQERAAWESASEAMSRAVESSVGAVRRPAVGERGGA